MKCKTETMTEQQETQAYPSRKNAVTSFPQTLTVTFISERPFMQSKDLTQN